MAVGYTLKTTSFIGLFAALAASLIATLWTRSPLFTMSAAEAPPAANATHYTPWADQPLAMIPTPQYETDRTDVFTVGATHMALLHNAIFRAFNSIYLQCSRDAGATPLTEVETRDLVGYANCWARLVAMHQEDEEANLFPLVAKMLEGQQPSTDDLFGDTLAEHRAFEAGFGALASYLESVSSSSSSSPPATFDAAKLKSLMDALLPPFEAHFRSEIVTLANLSSHPNAPQVGTPEDLAFRDVFKRWGKGTIKGSTDMVPMFLMNHDGEGFEDGKWKAWPPIPAPIRWGLVNIGGMWNGGWWRFASCDGMGNRKALHKIDPVALPADTAEDDAK